MWAARLDLPNGPGAYGESISNLLAFRAADRLHQSLLDRNAREIATFEPNFLRGITSAI
jgi:hypothetical protein